MTAPSSASPITLAERSAGDVLSMRARSQRRAAGSRIHPGIFRLVAGAYAWGMAAVWLTFAGTLESAYLIAIATLLLAMILGLPALMRRMEAGVIGRATTRSFADFIDGSADIGTGRVSGREVLVQVALIPAVLAFGFTAIGIEFALVRAGVL
jgi:hypothetical protein